MSLVCITKAGKNKAGKSRQTQKSGRVKAGLPVVCLAGYTNAGKSAIMNRLIDMLDPENGAGAPDAAEPSADAGCHCKCHRTDT